MSPSRRPVGSRAPVRVLAPASVARHPDRRRFLTYLGLSAAGAGLSCGGDEPRTGRRVGTSRGVESALSLYTWAEYQSPDNVRRFEREHALTVTIDVFESDEAMIAKLELQGPFSGYDLVVPSVPYVPQLVAKGLLQPLDFGKIPNVVHQDPTIVARKNAVGRERVGDYTVVKSWGATGFVYDRAVIDDDLETWSDFLRVAGRPEVSGMVSVLASPAALAGLVFWRDGIDWRTTDPVHLDHAESVLLSELAPHVRAFDSYPALSLLAGDYVLCQAWNGDARRAVLEAPDRYRWVLGAPTAELFIDTWALLENAPHPEAAHAWIDYVLDPEVSAREVEYIGYDTAVSGVQQHLGSGAGARELIFLTDDEKERLVTGEVNEAQGRLVDIYNRVKAAAARAG